MLNRFCCAGFWYQRWDSNPHGLFTHWILSPARLPVPPLWLGDASKNLLGIPIAALSGARNPHVLYVHSGSCAPFALLSKRPRRFFEASVLEVREKGLEPLRLTALVPKTSVYTNFTTLAIHNKKRIYVVFSFIKTIFRDSYTILCVTSFLLLVYSMPLHRFASLISWVISPVFVAPAAYFFVAVLGFKDDPARWDYLLVLFLASTIVPILLIYGLKKIGKVSDYNITFREQRFLPLLVMVGVNFLGYELMQQLAAPRIFTGILLFNAVNTVLILLITLQWKISIHLLTLASSIALLYLQFGAVAFWLLFLVPVLMWSRIYLKAHTFMQTLVGGLIGFLIMYAELKWWVGL